MGKRGRQRQPTNDWRVECSNRGNLATKVINFIEALPTTAGISFKLMPWQKTYLRKLLKTQKGERVIRNSLISCGRKNGKTGIGSGLMMAHLFCPALQKRGARIYSVANDRAQAALVFDELEGIILQCPELYDQVNIIRGHKIVEHEQLNIKYQAQASDSHRLQGLRPYFAIVDELGSFKDRDTYDAMKTAFGAQTEGLLLTASTQAARDEHVMSELYDYAIKVRDGGLRDDTFLPAIYSAPKDADIHDPKVWKLANPSLGAVRNIQELKSQAAKIQAGLSGDEPAFRNLILNQRVSPSAEIWIEPEAWNACAADYTAESLKGKQCVIGLDMSSVSDLTSLHAYFLESHETLHWCWSPRKTIEKAGNVPYQVWASNGLLEVSEGEAINQLDVLRKVCELHKEYDVVAVGYDLWRLERLESDLDAMGLQTNLQAVGLGYKTMSPAVARLEQLVLERQLKHQSSPLVMWNLQNIFLDRDAAGNRKPNKTKAADKIDCVVSLLIAVAAATECKPSPLPSLVSL